MGPVKEKYEWKYYIMTNISATFLALCDCHIKVTINKYFGRRK